MPLNFEFEVVTIFDEGSPVGLLFELLLVIEEEAPVRCGHGKQVCMSLSGIQIHVPTGLGVWSGMLEEAGVTAARGVMWRVVRLACNDVTSVVGYDNVAVAANREYKIILRSKDILMQYCFGRRRREICGWSIEAGLRMSKKAKRPTLMSNRPSHLPSRMVHFANTRLSQSVQFCHHMHYLCS